MWHRDPRFLRYRNWATYRIPPPPPPPPQPYVPTYIPSLKTDTKPAEAGSEMVGLGTVLMLIGIFFWPLLPIGGCVLVVGLLLKASARKRA